MSFFRTQKVKQPMSFNTRQNNVGARINVPVSRDALKDFKGVGVILNVAPNRNQRREYLRRKSSSKIGVARKSTPFADSSL